MSLNKQQKIVNWFDITYKRKGFSYLRTSEAYEVFTKILNLKSGDSVLDVACGPGLFLSLATFQNDRVLVGAALYLLQKNV